MQLICELVRSCERDLEGKLRAAQEFASVRAQSLYVRGSRGPPTSLGTSPGTAPITVAMLGWRILARTLRRSAA